MQLLRHSLAVSFTEFVFNLFCCQCYRNLFYLSVCLILLLIAVNLLIDCGELIFSELIISSVLYQKLHLVLLALTSQIKPSQYFETSPITTEHPTSFSLNNDLDSFSFLEFRVASIFIVVCYKWQLHAKETNAVANFPSHFKRPLFPSVHNKMYNKNCWFSITFEQIATCWLALQCARMYMFQSLLHCFCLKE